MNFRYTPLQRNLKKIYRKFFPISKYTWMDGHINDLCAINLVPRQKLIEFFKDCTSLLRSIKGDDVGDYLEFGVFNGNSIGNMYIARNLNKLKSTRLFGFDAFEGLPAGAEDEDGGVWKKGFYACSFEKMQECLLKRDINPNDITWIKGWYENTLNEETKQKLQLKNIGIVFIDCDIYSSSKAVLEFIKPFLNQAVILCFDDWKLNDLDIKEMGEYRAFNEFLEENTDLEAREIKSYRRKSKSFLVKSKK